MRESPGCDSAMSRKFSQQCNRERTGETWDNALLYAFKLEVRAAALLLSLRAHVRFCAQTRPRTAEAHIANNLCTRTAKHYTHAYECTGGLLTRIFA